MYVILLYVYLSKNFQPYLFSAPEIFIPLDTEQKLAPENGVDLWHRFLERVSWALDVSSQQYNSYQQAGTVETSAGRRNVEHQLTTVDSDQLNVQCRPTDHHVAVTVISQHTPHSVAIMTQEIRDDH